MLQEELKLQNNDDAPLLFWPSRLDPIQKGCQLFADILLEILAAYQQQCLQVVFISSGPYRNKIAEIIHSYNLEDRVALCDFDRRLASIAYAAADFILMPSSYEPCGLPQMIAQKYGALPIVRATGGLKDTVRHIDHFNDTGNGFVFEHFDNIGLRWAIDQAMEFYMLPFSKKRDVIQRTMRDAAINYNQSVTTQNYVKIYEQLVDGPVLDPTFEFVED